MRPKGIARVLVFTHETHIYGLHGLGGSIHLLHEPVHPAPGLVHTLWLIASVDMKQNVGFARGKGSVGIRFCTLPVSNMRNHIILTTVGDGFGVLLQEGDSLGAELIN